MNPDTKRRRTLDAIKRLLLRESLSQPLILIFADLHWVDEGSQVLLNLLVESIGTARVLILVNYCREYSHSWGNKSFYSQLRLDPLDFESSEEMLSALLGESRDLIALKRVVVEKTEGNPFFMEEIVQALFEQGALGFIRGVLLATILPGASQSESAKRGVVGPAIGFCLAFGQSRRFKGISYLHFCFDAHKRNASRSKPNHFLGGKPMRYGAIVVATLLVSMATLGWSVPTVHADGDIHKVNHVIIVMQENHSFDNYFGALPYDPAGPYHGGPCFKNDHSCVDGLTCTVDSSGNFSCANSNLDAEDNSIVTAFHEPRYCTGPDLDHSWSGSHLEANFEDPAGTLLSSPNDGFVRRNDTTSQGQPDSGPETAESDDTMGFYTQADLPFYYNLAENFAIDDRYFCSVIGQTFPNRAYAAAATSFGHLTTAEILPPPGGYKPITGTIYDLLDANNVTWTNYFSDVPISGIFRQTPFPFIVPPHSLPLSLFLAQAATGTLPSVSFVDPNFGFFGPGSENDEHPPTDIRKGESFVSQVVNAVRNGPNWKDSIIFITYDEHGGFYDHVSPAPAPQDGALNPDGIDPGQCADLSNPPSSETPGNGAQCAVSRMEALAICEAFTPLGPYPADCANFNQLGFRVPFIAVSPFAKPHYVSHTVGDHTSMLALIEKRFLSSNNGNGNSHIQSLTARDADADPLEDMFNFSNPPSLNTPVTTAPPSSPMDPGCPFVPGGPQG